MLERDEGGRLHSLHGPAVLYPDGWAIYAVHGVRVPERVILDPGSLTVAEIEAEKNAEVRRVMLERYGITRYIVESKAEHIHQDEYGELYRRELTGDEPLVVVKVLNSTQEADGSRHVYFLRVQPECRPMLGDKLGMPQLLTARNAVASTFGLRGEEYAPEKET